MKCLKVLFLLTLIGSMAAASIPSIDVPLISNGQKKSEKGFLAENLCGVCKINGGTGVIPWGMEQPFPWTTVSGLWRARYREVNKYVSYLDFNVVRDDQNGERQLYVRELDIQNCELLSVGMGREVRDKFVDIQMTPLDGAYSAYKLRIRTFDHKDYPIAADEGMVNDGKVLLMTYFQLDTPNVYTRFHLGRVSDSSNNGKICGFLR